MIYFPAGEVVLISFTCLSRRLPFPMTSRLLYFSLFPHPVRLEDQPFRQTVNSQTHLGGIEWQMFTGQYLTLVAPWLR